jgi:citronellol/citronellal dehydrogenase
MFQQDIFKGKTVLVTGGGTGIGYSISEMFLNFGAEVIIASRKMEKLEKALETLSALGNCKAFALDIRD